MLAEEALALASIPCILSCELFFAQVGKDYSADMTKSCVQGGSDAVSALILGMESSHR